MQHTSLSVLFVLSNSALNRGMNTGIENLAWGLADREVQVHVLAGGSPPKSQSYSISDSIEYHFTNASGDNPVNFISTYKELIAKRQIDFVVGWILNIALLAEMPESNEISFIANQGQMAPRSIFLSFLKRCFLGKVNMHESIRSFTAIKRISKNIDSVVCISDAVRRSCITAYRLTANKFLVIPRGVDTDIFQFVSKKAISVKPKLLYAGNITHGKGIDDLVSALEFIEKPVQLILCGKAKDDYIDLIYRKLKNQKKRHILTCEGPQKQNDLVRYYQECDIFVFPSHSEGLGKVLIEAMSCGCPVICSDIDTFKEVVTHKYDALMAPVKSPQGLASAIEKFLQDEELRKKCGMNARKTVEERFSKECELDSWMKILQKRKAGI